MVLNWISKKYTTTFTSNQILSSRKEYSPDTRCQTDRPMDGQFDHFRAHAEFCPNHHETSMG